MRGNKEARSSTTPARCLNNKGYKVYKGKRPQSRRLTANLVSFGRRGGVGKKSCAQKVKHTFDGESRPGDWST
eukprot:1139760-Pelagomonas_calceolata.AAC.1